MSEKLQNRLFVPLNTEAFNWFKEGKKWEVRKKRGQYNPRNVFKGKKVELRKGYTGESIWGKILDVDTFENADRLFEKINFKEVFPDSGSLSSAKKLIQNYVDSNEIIAFKIQRDQDRSVEYLEFHEDYFEQVLKGQKTSTVRKGSVIPKKTSLPLRFSKIKKSLIANVKKVDYTYTFDTLTDEIAQMDGFRSKLDLKSALKRHYPSMTPEDRVTIIEFEI